MSIKRPTTPTSSEPVSSPTTPKRDPTERTTPPSHSPSKKRKPAVKSETALGEWTADKREHLIEKLLVAGIKVLGTQELAAELGVTPLQVRNATQAGRKGNLRDKAIKAVRGD